MTGGKPRLLALGAVVEVAGQRRSIERLSGTDSAPIVRLEGVADREAASSLRRQEIFVAAAEAPRLPEGEWWAHQLEGCEARDGQRSVGTVIRLIELPSCEALEVRRAAGGQNLLVPMVTSAIRSIDVERREIDIDLRFLGETA